MAVADNIRPLSLQAFEASIAARNPPGLDCVNARALAASTAEGITVPATEPTAAHFVRLAVTEDCYFSVHTTATVPGDVTDGTASEYLPAKSVTWLYVRGVTTISVITAAAGGAIVTASFYRN
jgi:hypothetical protein